MALLRAKPGSDLSLVIRFVARVAEPDLTLLSTAIELSRADTTILSGEVSLTPSDVDAISRALVDVCSDASRAFFFVSTDYDFHIDARSHDWQPDDDISFGFWIGEPYDLMTGFKFVVTAEDLREFAVQLDGEGEAAAQDL